MVRIQVYASVYILSKKFTSIGEGLVVVAVSRDSFFSFYFAVLEFFSIFLMFWKMICSNRSWAHPLLQIIYRGGHVTCSYKSDF